MGRNAEPARLFRGARMRILQRGQPAVKGGGLARAVSKLVGRTLCTEGTMGRRWAAGSGRGGGSTRPTFGRGYGHPYFERPSRVLLGQHWRRPARRVPFDAAVLEVAAELRLFLVSTKSRRTESA